MPSDPVFPCSLLPYLTLCLPNSAEQELLLQQRLTEVDHPDHLVITYPNLGHLFAPSNQWITAEGPVEYYVLQDMYEWLASPARDLEALH